jgi:hypothetical protein
MADTKRTLIELAHYPEHGPRPEDPHYKIFNQARTHLVDVLAVGCWIGGATKTQIETGLPADHQCVGCQQLEAHHHIAEWAGLSEIDWQKVAPDFPQLGIHSDEDFLCAAESEGGLMILCDIHHRGSMRGIHAITEPVWKLQRYEVDDYRFIPEPTHPAIGTAPVQPEPEVATTD